MPVKKSVPGAGAPGLDSNIITSGEGGILTTPAQGAQESAAGNIASDINTRTVKVTFFKNEAAQSQRVRNLTLPDLCSMITDETAASKMELPWLASDR